MNNSFFHSFFAIYRGKSLFNFKMIKRIFLNPAVSIALYFLVFGEFIGKYVPIGPGHNYIEFMVPV